MYIDSNRSSSSETELSSFPSAATRSVDNLSKKRVQPDAVASTTEPRISAVQMTADLQSMLKLDMAKSGAILHTLGDGNLVAAFQARLIMSDHAEAQKMLQDCVHFRKGAGAALTKEARMETRLALAIAFARGASTENIRDLRIYCEFSPFGDQKEILESVSDSRTDIALLLLQKMDQPAFKRNFAHQAFW